MQYTIGTLIVAIIALVLLTRDGSSNRKTVPKAPVSRYYRVSPNVFNEADGSIAQVNTWLSQKIGDPEVAVQEWGQVTREGRGFEAEVVIRNRNAYGVWMPTKYKFEFNALGHVMNAYDVETHARLTLKATQTLEADLNALERQIQLVHSQLARETSSLASAQGEGKISSRSIKVDSLYRSLQQLNHQRDALIIELYETR